MAWPLYFQVRTLQSVLLLQVPDIHGYLDYQDHVRVHRINPHVIYPIHRC